MNEPVQIAIEMLKWEKRSIVLTAFGLVGFGCMVGAGSVYFLFLKNKIESRFQIQAENIHELRGDIEELKKTISKLKINENVLVNNTRTFESTLPGPIILTTSETKPSTDEDEEYVTASESEDEDEAKPKRFKGEISQDEAKEEVEGEVEEKGSGEPSEQYQLAQFFAKIDILLDSGIEDQHEAYNLLRINKDKLQNLCDFWWRFAKAAHMEGAAAGVAGNKEIRRAHIETAATYAENAVTLNDYSADAHKWYAITVGNQSEFLGINEKIKVGYKFKEHVDRAVMLNPQDSTCYYLLGRFCFDVSQLSWVERKVAATLFSNLPTSTTKEALEYFKKCENLRPFLDNRFSMAKCYIAMGDKEKAARWLQISADMPANSASDKATHDLVMQLLPKYRKYLN